MKCLEVSTSIRRMLPDPQFKGGRMEFEHAIRMELEPGELEVSVLRHLQDTLSHLDHVFWKKQWAVAQERIEEHRAEVAARAEAAEQPETDATTNGHKSDQKGGD